MGPPIVGVSKNIKKIKEVIEHVANTGLNTIIYGESGVGKEVVAQTLYHKSSRKGQPFIKINCAALPEGLLESELFGYERGAFTGADQKKRGKFELANKGVLFLDEIGDMSLPLQSKLLHVLQSGEFAPLGSEKEFRTDTWVIAATNHDLEIEIEKGQFREDLFYRLNIIKIFIQPLRERPEDIPRLIDYYTKEYSSQFNRKNPVKLSPSIMDRLMAYHWPGNVRELQNILKRMLVLEDHDEIVNELEASVKTTEEVTADGQAPTKKQDSISDMFDLEGRNSPENKSFSLKKIKRVAVDKVEKEVISYVLDKTDWNRSKASKILKISYKTLLYKITDLNIKSKPITKH